MYDFLDLGSKHGGSIGYCQNRFGGNGTGIDLNPDNVYTAQQKGYDIKCADALKVEFEPKSFRYVSMMDFLEHLPGEDAVVIMLDKCAKWATDFLFISHPPFEDMDYLKNLGLKIDWTDWHGHTAMLSAKDFERIFEELNLKDYVMQFKLPIYDSSSHHIIPIEAPTDTIGDEGWEKPLVRFDKEIYKRLEIFIPLRKFEGKEWEKIIG